uniref:CTCHY-type domain-containing protein n=1 Tax=Macrostomum lignano TaxID=282301 RepID=A0A1I8FQQ8_9PLAT
RPGACSAESGAASALSAPNCCRLDEALATPRRLRAYCLDCGRLALGSSELAPAPPTAAAAAYRSGACWPPPASCGAHRPAVLAVLLLPPPSLAYLLRLVRRLRCQRLVCVGCPACTRPPATRPSGGRRCRSLLLDADLRLAEFFPDCLAFNMFNAAVPATGWARQIPGWRRKRRSDSVCLIVADPPFGGLLTPLMDCLQHLADLAAAAGHCERPRSLPSGCSPTVPESRLPPLPGTSWCFRLRPAHSAHWNPHCAACGTCATLHPPARLHCQRCNRCVKAKYIDSHGCRSGLSAAKEN